MAFVGSAGIAEKPGNANYKAPLPDKQRLTESESAHIIRRSVINNNIYGIICLYVWQILNPRLDLTEIYKYANRALLSKS